MKELWTEGFQFRPLRRPQNERPRRKAKLTGNDLTGNEYVNRLTSTIIVSVICPLFIKIVSKSIRDDPNQISRKNSLELIELSSINKVSLV
jgi:hypothetical protein